MVASLVFFALFRASLQDQPFNIKCASLLEELTRILDASTRFCGIVGKVMVYHKRHSEGYVSIARREEAMSSSNMFLCPKRDRGDVQSFRLSRKQFRGTGWTRSSQVSNCSNSIIDCRPWQWFPLQDTLPLCTSAVNPPRTPFNGPKDVSSPRVQDLDGLVSDRV